MAQAVAAAQTAQHKNFLRRFYRSRVLSIPDRRRRALSEKAARRLASLPAFMDAQTVGLYVAVAGEVDTEPLFGLCRRMGKAVAVPVIFPEERRMEYAILSGPGRWTRNACGIPEPADKRLLDHRNVELLLVPGRVFTPGGGRLGTGGGYFDRFLARHPAAVTVGLAFDEQVLARVPADELDRPVDWVVTPSRVHAAGEARRD